MSQTHVTLERDLLTLAELAIGVGDLARRALGPHVHHDFPGRIIPGASCDTIISSALYRSQAMEDRAIWWPFRPIPTTFPLIVANGQVAENIFEPCVCSSALQTRIPTETRYRIAMHSSACPGNFSSCG